MLIFMLLNETISCHLHNEFILNLLSLLSFTL